MKNQKTTKKIIEGTVVSDKMAKTIVVRVEKFAFHGLYHRKMKRSKKYKAHDEKGQAQVGDRVKIVEARPYSKDKCFRLLEVLK